MKQPNIYFSKQEMRDIIKAIEVYLSDYPPEYVPKYDKTLGRLKMVLEWKGDIW